MKRKANAAVAWMMLLALGGAAAAQSVVGKTPHGMRFGVSTGPTHSQQTAESIRKSYQQKLKLHLELAEELIAKEAYERAISRLKAAIAIPLNDSRRQDAYAHLKRISDQAEDEFDDARNLYLAGKYVEARGAASRVATLYRGVPAATKAYRLLKAIDADPKAIAVLNEAKAKDLYEQAQKVRALLKDDPDRIVDLYDRLEVLLQDRFRDTTAGKAAKAELDKIQADPGAMARIEKVRAEREIASRMAMARNYLNAGLIEKAVEIWNQIIAEHPDTEHARTAQALKGKP